jgi:hypothetical protein
MRIDNIFIPNFSSLIDANLPHCILYFIVINTAYVLQILMELYAYIQMYMYSDQVMYY